MPRSRNLIPDLFRQMLNNGFYQCNKHFHSVYSFGKQCLKHRIIDGPVAADVMWRI